MLTSSAITDNIVINAETGLSAAVGSRDFSGIAVFSQAGTAAGVTAFTQCIRTLNSVSPGGEPFRLRYNRTNGADYFTMRIQDDTGPRTLNVTTANPVAHRADDTICLVGWAFDFSAREGWLWAQVVGGTKRSGNATNTAMGNIPEPTGIIIGKNGGGEDAYVGSSAVAFGTGLLTEANFDDIYTAFSTSPTWGALKEYATLASAVTWHVGFPITTGSGT